MVLSLRRPLVASSHWMVVASLSFCCSLVVLSCRTLVLSWSSHCTALSSPHCAGWLLHCLLLCCCLVLSLHRTLILLLSSHCVAVLLSHCAGWLLHHLSLNRCLILSSCCSLVLLSSSHCAALSSPHCFDKASAVVYWLVLIRNHGYRQRSPSCRGQQC